MTSKRFTGNFAMMTGAASLVGDGADVVLTDLDAMPTSTPHVVDTCRKAIPARCVGQPLEIAALAAFLASDEAGFIGGTAIPIDGAMTAGAGQPDFVRLLRENPEPCQQLIHIQRTIQ